MSDALARYEQAMADLIAERTTGDGDRWPITAYVCIAITVDPETMSLEEPEWIIADSQRNYITRGIIEQARDELIVDSTSALNYYATYDGDADGDD